MKSVLILGLIVPLFVFLAGCGILPGSATEKVRQEPNKAVYRSAGPSDDDASSAIAPRQKIPGE